MTEDTTVMESPAPAPAAEPAPAETPAPTPSAPPTGSFIGDGGTLHFEHAASALPKDLHGNIDGFKARFEGKTVGDLFKSYNELEGQFTQLKQSRAVPESATLEAYGINRPESLSEDIWKQDSPKIEKFVQLAHESGIGKEEFGKLFNAYAETLAADYQQAEDAAREAKQSAFNELVDAWGSEFDARRQTAANHVDAVLRQLDLPADSPHVRALFDNPAFIRIMHHQARETGEGDTTLPPGAAPSVLSGAEKAHDIMTNPANPLHEKFVQESKQGGGPTIDYVQKLRSNMRRRG